MPTEREGQSPFIEGTSLQFAWDATSLTLLMDCPWKYQQVMIEGYRPKGSSVHLRFGGLFASALEQYHKLRIEATHDFALERVVETVLMETWDGDKPWDSQHSKKTRETLVRSIVWYLDNYKDDPTKTIILESGKPAVELSFRFESDIRAPNGKPYILSGHLDRLVQFGEEKFVQDQKTTGSTIGPYFFSEFSPHTQMSLYTLASRVVFKTLVSGVMIDGVQIAVGFTAFGRSFTMRSEDQLEEWLGNVGTWLRLAETFASTGLYPRNEASCHKYGGCQFRNICSKSPSVRQQFIDTDFEKSNPWNPLKDR